MVRSEDVVEIDRVQMAINIVGSISKFKWMIRLEDPGIQ